MKNKFFALGLIALSLATVSCSNDDVSTDKVSAVETAKVSFNVKAEGNPTGKTTIDRNAAPLFVNEVTIWANGLSSTLQSFDFGTGTGLPTGFFLNNVALGSNTFGATSTGADSDKVVSLSSADWDLAKAKTPYVRCSSVPSAPIVIKKNGNPTVNLTMVTDYGRILAKFVQESDVSQYYVTVEATTPSMDDMGVYGTQTLPEVKVTPTTVFQWSDEYAVFINKATFTIRIYANNGGVKGALLNTINKEVQIAKAKTKLCTFTIKNTDVHTNIESGGITLTFPTIVDETIND